MTKSIQVSADGELYATGNKLDDKEFCKSFLETLEVKDFVCFGEFKGERVRVEAKSQPLVVQDVNAKDDSLELTFNYGVTKVQDISANPLYLDDWSRLCGLTDNDVPFVFSLKAQTDFFLKVATPIDSETFTLNKKEYELDEWYIPSEEAPEAKFWSQRYEDEHTPWDLRTHHKAIDQVLPRIKLSKSKILVPGSGRGHDAAKLSKLGHQVVGLDFSQKAVEESSTLYPEGPKFTTGDIFNTDEILENHGEFDCIFEHTLFCAVNPSRRGQLVKSWKRLLRDQGCIFGVFNVSCRRQGPPFGITEWELEELLEPHFTINMWGRLNEEESPRAGKELFVHAQKKKG